MKSCLKTCCINLTMAMTMLHHLGQVVVRQAEGGEYNGEVGWERVDRAFKLRSRNKYRYLFSAFQCL